MLGMSIYLFQDFKTELTCIYVRDVDFLFSGFYMLGMSIYLFQDCKTELTCIYVRDVDLLISGF